MRSQIANAVGRVPRPTALGRFRPFGPVLLALTAAGCFTYNDMAQTTALPGREIRVDLNATGRAALVSEVGPEVRSVTGLVDASDTSGLTIAISKTTIMDGDVNGWHGEQVVIPYRYIAHSGERTLSKGKTVALVALVAGAMSGLALLVGHAAGASGSSGQLPSPGK